MSSLQPAFRQAEYADGSPIPVDPEMQGYRRAEPAATGRTRDVTQRLAQLSNSSAVRQMVGSASLAKKVIIDNAKKSSTVTFEEAPSRDDVTTPDAEDPTYMVVAETPGSRADIYAGAATPHTAKFGFTATPGNHMVDCKPQGEYVTVDTPNSAPVYLTLGEEQRDQSPYTIIEPMTPETVTEPTREQQPQRTSLDEHALEAASDMPTPELFQFAACGQLQFLAESINAGISIDLVDGSGRTSLMYSLQYGQVECANWLLGKGANVNAADNTGSTALHYSAQGTNHHVVKMLLQNGANWVLTDQEGRTPLHWAMKTSSGKIVSMLIGRCNEAGINAVDLNNMTALMWAAFYGQVGHMEKLRAAGALCEAEDDSGRTALHWSLFSGSIDCVKNIINYERTFAQDVAGKSALHFAAENGFNKAIKHITTVRPQAVHDIDVNGRTPLHWAAACKHVSTVECLLKFGAHPTRIDASGRTALDYARAVGCESAVAILGHIDCENAQQPRLGPAGASTSIKSFESGGTMGNMDEEARYLLRQLAAGSQLSKYSHAGKGPLQKRYFWLDCFTGELCWSKAVAKGVKDPKNASSAYLVEISRRPSAAIRSRADFDEGGKHRYAFELICEDRSLDLVAPSEKVMNLWVDGLQMLKDYAIHVLEDKTTKGMSSSSLQVHQ